MSFRLVLLRLLQRIFGAENVRVVTDEDRAMRAFEKEANRRRRANPDPRTLDEVLEQLRDYCIPYFYRDYPGVAIPKEFWTIEDDDLFYDVLSLMPLFVMEKHVAGADVPIGFKLAWPIFELEDGYLTDGWTTISNAGEETLRRAIDAYRTIGMETEAVALEAVHRAYTADPDDDDALPNAYASVPNPYGEGDNKQEALQAYFARNRQLFAGPTSR